LQRRWLAVLQLVAVVLLQGLVMGLRLQVAQVQHQQLVKGQQQQQQEVDYRQHCKQHWPML
jgi:hypothetical protein